MTELPERERFILEAVSGWLMLDNAAEARRELAQVSCAFSSHPEVLLREWDIHAHLHAWPEAVQTAERLIRRDPAQPEGYVKKAYALHELKRTREAWECLHPLSLRFRDAWIIPYNLACYACQLGDHNDALRWLERARKAGDAEQILSMALQDADLLPVRQAIQDLRRQIP